MDLLYTEYRNHPAWRAGVQFCDWDRVAVNGNCAAFFIWAVGEDGPPDVQRITLRSEGQSVGELTTMMRTRDVLTTLVPGREDRAVFAHVGLNRLVLPEQGVVEVIFTDGQGEEFHLADIHYEGNRAALLVSKVDLELAPIMIMSLGRSGSTVLANALGLHPKVLAIGGYPFEYRFFSYCLQAALVAGSPANHDCSMGGDSFEMRHPFNVGFNPFNRREYDQLIGSDHFRDHYERRLAPEAVRFFLEQAADAIGEHARRKRGVVAFVEKMAGPHLAEFAWNVVEGTCEIVIVREFWDLVRSMLAFDQKRGTSSFFNATTPIGADEWLIDMARRQGHMRRRAKRAGRIEVAYEEMMQSPRETLSALAHSLGIENGAAELDAMMVPFGDNEYAADHATREAKAAIDLDATFSKQAQEEAQALIDKVVVGAGGEGNQPLLWRLGRSEDDPDARLITGGTTAGRSAEEGAGDAGPGGVDTRQRAAWARERARLERDVSAMTKRTERSEISNQRLRDELTRMRREVALDRRARDGELVALTDRANRAEEYNRALIANHDRAIQEAIVQIDQSRERAERAEEYNRSLIGAGAGAGGEQREADLRHIIAEREREIADFGKQVAALEDRARRAEEYSQSLLAECERLSAAAVPAASPGDIETLRKILAAREREVADAAAHVAGLEDRAKRAEEYAHSLAADRENSAKREEQFRFVIAEREREIAGAKEYLAGLEDRAKRSEEYCASLVAARTEEERVRADLQYIVSEREREIAAAKREVAAFEARARRAEEYGASLVAELEKHKASAAD